MPSQRTRFIRSLWSGRKHKTKGLFTNDFTDEDKARLGKTLTEDNMATDAEVAEMLDQVFGTGDGEDTGD